MKFISAAVLAASLVSAQNLPFSNSTSNYCSKACTPFAIDLTWGAVDSTKLLGRQAILTNGSIPGPPLRLKVGECVDFTVYNNMQRDTGVHFHGIRQRDTPWSDGVPGLTQHAIKAGQKYTYRWTADEPGIYFYHSHYKSQLMDGLYGAIIISDDTASKPFSSISGGDASAMVSAEKKLTPIMAGDWSRFTAEEILAFEDAANIDYACQDSIVLNGMGSSYCLTAAQIKANQRPQVANVLAAQNQTLTPKGCVPANNNALQGAGYTRNLAALPSGAYDQCTSALNKNYTLTVDPAEKWAAMAFISPSGIETFAITIDGHKLYIYQINGHYVQPQTVDQITIAPGDRVSFFVKLDQPAADYTIRVANAGINQVLSGYGVLSYKGATGPGSAPALMNVGGVSPPNSTITALNYFGAAPFPAVPVSPTADRTFILSVGKNPSNGKADSWVLNKESYSQDNDDETPLLYLQPSAIPQSDLVLRTNYNEWVDVIVIVQGPLAQPHPIHKHANKFFVVGSGTGAFNYSSVAQAQAAGKTFNLANPAYVDGYTTVPAQGTSSWMVFRYQANTPGAWFLHCHIQTHFSGGMAVAILDSVDKWPTVPPNVDQQCGADNGTTTSSSSVSSTSTVSGTIRSSTTLTTSTSSWTTGTISGASTSTSSVSRSSVSGTASGSTSRSSGPTSRSTSTVSSTSGPSTRTSTQSGTITSPATTRTVRPTSQTAWLPWQSATRGSIIGGTKTRGSVPTTTNPVDWAIWKSLSAAIDHIADATTVLVGPVPDARAGNGDLHIVQAGSSQPTGTGGNGSKGKDGPKYPLANVPGDDTSSVTWAGWDAVTPTATFSMTPLPVKDVMTSWATSVTPAAWAGIQTATPSNPVAMYTGGAAGRRVGSVIGVVAVMVLM